MSTPLPTLGPQASAPTSRRGPLPEWLREPLLHFLVLGGLLFAVDHVIVGRADDPRHIVIPAAVDQEAGQLFKDSRGRPPNAEELKALRERWLDNEVLYREGLALQLDRGDTAIRERVIFKALSVVDLLDRGDTAIRERVIFKALSVVDANVKRPPVDDKLLRAWFESQRARYDEPARYDFQEAVLAGDNSEAALRAFVDALNAGTPGDAKAGLRVFKGRPLANLAQSYGPDFAKALEESPVGEWRALATRDGLRAMRLESIAPARPASFDAVRGVVLQDWTDAVMAEQRTAAVRALAGKYRVTTEAAPR